MDEQAWTSVCVAAMEVPPTRNLVLLVPASASASASSAVPPEFSFLVTVVPLPSVAPNPPTPRAVADAFLLSAPRYRVAHAVEVGFVLPVGVDAWVSSAR